MAMLLLRSTWGKISIFSLKKLLYSRSKGIHIGFLVHIRNQRLKIDPVPNFSQIGQDKGNLNFDLE